MRLRTLARFAAVVTAYGYLPYSVPAVAIGGALYLLVHDPDEGPEANAELFLQLVPGAPLTLPIVAYAAIEDTISTRLRQRQARHEARRRSKVILTALLHFTIKCLKYGIQAGIDHTKGTEFVLADVNEDNFDDFERAVHELLREYETAIPPRTLVSRIRPNKMFDEAWLQRRGFLRDQTA